MQTMTDYNAASEIDGAHVMTKAQYREARIRQFAAEYGLTLAEAPDLMCEDTERDHFRACYDACASGIRLRRAVLDSLPAGMRAKILHDWPDVNAGYLPPDVRAINRASEAEMREARRG